MKRDIQRINTRALLAAVQVAHDRAVAAACYIEAMANDEPKTTALARRNVLRASAAYLRSGIEPLSAILAG